MKKVSTTAAAQSRNISRQKLTIGLDLGDHHSWYCGLDEAGQVKREQRVRTAAWQCETMSARSNARGWNLRTNLAR